MEEFPDRLRQLRERRRISRRALAQLCGLSDGVVARYERGEKAPSVATLIRLADFFGVSVDALLGRDVSCVPPVHTASADRGSMVSTQQRRR